MGNVLLTGASGRRGVVIDEKGNVYTPDADGNYTVPEALADSLARSAGLKGAQIIRPGDLPPVASSVGESRFDLTADKQKLLTRGAVAMVTDFPDVAGDEMPWMPYAMERIWTGAQAGAAVAEDAVYPGMQIWAVALGVPRWRNADNDGWVDSAGTPAYVTPTPTPAFSPLDAASSVAVSVHPTVTFPMAMNPDTISADTIQLLRDPEGDAEIVDASLSLSEDGTTVTITPSDPLANDEAYSIAVSGLDNSPNQVEDIAGTPLPTSLQQAAWLTVA